MTCPKVRAAYFSRHDVGLDKHLFPFGSREAVDKWTEEHCPLTHSPYGYDGIRGSSGGRAGFGGLIQTAFGNGSGTGNPFTKRRGFFW